MNFPTTFRAFLRLRCPHCGETPVFAPVSSLRSIAGWFDTRPGCPRCRYLFEREPGYFLMATWATVFFPSAFFALALMLLIMTARDWGDARTIAVVSLATAPFALAIARHGRVLFLIIDHWFDPLAEDDHAAWRRAAGEPAPAAPSH